MCVWGGGGGRARASILHIDTNSMIHISYQIMYLKCVAIKIAVYMKYLQWLLLSNIAQNRKCQHPAVCHGLKNEPIHAGPGRQPGSESEPGKNTLPSNTFIFTIC